MLPDFTRPQIWLDPAREDHLPTPPPPRVIEHMQGYTGLELVVGGAVDECDVVLTFVG